MGVAEQREFGRVGFGIEVRVSLACAGSWTRKQEEWSKYFVMTILAFLGSGRQLASVVVFVMVLLTTGVVEVALIDQKQEIGKRGESPGARGDMDGRPSENIEQQRKGGQPSDQNQRSQKREIRRKRTEITKHKR